MTGRHLPSAKRRPYARYVASSSLCKINVKGGFPETLQGSREGQVPGRGRRWKQALSERGSGGESKLVSQDTTVRAGGRPQLGGRTKMLDCIIAERGPHDPCFQ